MYRCLTSVLRFACVKNVLRAFYSIRAGIARPFFVLCWLKFIMDAVVLSYAVTGSEVVPAVILRAGCRGVIGHMP